MRRLNFTAYSIAGVLLFIQCCVVFFSPYFFSRYSFNSGSVQGKTVSISASIGGDQFFLYGYASPQSLITLEGIGLYEQTYSDGNGYFTFTNSYAPLNPTESCLTAQDQLGRLSTPVCIPPFPVSYQATVGPVILPPTVSLNRSDYFIGDMVELSGQSIPNSEVQFSVFSDESNLFSKLFHTIPLLPKPAYAVTFPNLSTKSDTQGNFSLSLPSENSEKYRVFAQVTYNSSPSPNSARLTVTILPIWFIILKLFGILFGFFKPRIMEISFLFELGILLWILLTKFFVPHYVQKSRTLLILPPESLLVLDKTLMIRPSYSMLKGSKK